MTAQNNQSIFRRLIARIGNPLEWSRVDRGLLLCFVTLGFLFDYLGVAVYVLDRPERARYLNLDVLRAGITALWVAGIGWAVLIVIGLYLRARRPESVAYTYWCIQYLAITDGAFAYLQGPATSPFAITLLLGAGIIGFLLFDVKPVLWGLFSFSALLLGTTVAEFQGWLPYAPILKELPFVDGHPAFWWSVGVGGLSFLVAAVALAIGAYTFSRWHDREQRLADAHEELKQAYDELARTKDQLVRAEALASLGSLVSGAAHELRNPLGSSGALLQTLREDLGRLTGISEEERAEVLDVIERALKGQGRAAAIVERLYDLTDALAQGAPDAILGEVVETLRKQYGQVRFHVSDEAAGTRVSRRNLTTILTNLLDNAVAAGGTEPVQLDARRAVGGLELTVTDTGCGIPAAQQSEVFKPFFTGAKAGEGHGVGLGLYIVHELVTRKGGSVALESDPGRGTRVWVRLPLQ